MATDLIAAPSADTYEGFVQRLELPPDAIAAIVENPADQIPFPAGTTGVRVAQSPIHTRIGPDEFEVAIRSLPGHLLGDCCPLQHEFYPGYYLRTVTMFADHLFLGRCHRTAHWNVVSRGRMTVRGMDGDVREYIAPVAFFTEPGTQKMMCIIEETDLTTIHATSETDLMKLEHELIDDRINPYLGVAVGAPLTGGVLP